MSTGVRTHSTRLVTVYGGSGFVGRHVVRALARRGWRVRVAVRRPDLAGFLAPQGLVGQIHFVQANLRYPRSVEAAAVNAGAVVNLVGILQPSGRQGFEAVHGEGAGAVARAAAPGARVVHVSAIGADAASPSAYARTKARGEALVLAARPDAVVLRPSVIFGPEDQFFNRFAALGRVLPVLPLAGAGTRFQPVFVGDVAEAVARAVEGAAAGGAPYELGGPDTRTLRELVEATLAMTGRRRLVLDLPAPLARLQAGAMELLDLVSFGLLPENLRLTRDQVRLLESDNVVSEASRAAGRTLEGLGIQPESFEATMPPTLLRYRRTGQFARGRGQHAAAPGPGGAPGA